jgi:hypothetical protein
VLASNNLVLLKGSIVKVYAVTNPRTVLAANNIIDSVPVLRSNLVATLIHSLNLVWLLSDDSPFFFTGENGHLHLFH